MDYSKYFTPQDIATFLVNQLNLSKTPQNAIDICCGSCNLLSAVKEKWPNISIKGVDIIKHKTNQLFNIKIQDGRDFALKNRKKYDLVLANPPFGKLDKIDDYNGLYINKFSAMYSNRLECEMFIANLKLLSNTGTLLIIIPSTIIEGSSFFRFRCELEKYYSISYIYYLPANTFGNSSIRCCALVINNLVSNNYTRLKYNVIRNKAGEYKLIKHKSNYEENKVLNYFKIYRGNLSSNKLNSRDGKPVFHTSKKMNEWRPTIRYIKEIPLNCICVNEGDLLISRIGKSAGCWNIYTGVTTPISDCLLVVRRNEKFSEINFKEINFLHLIKGLTTQYVSSDDINRYLSSLLNKN